MTIAILQHVAIVPAVPAFFLPGDQVPAANVVAATVGALLNITSFVLIVAGLPRGAKNARSASA